MTPEQSAKLRAPFNKAAVSSIPRITKPDGREAFCKTCGSSHKPAVHLSYVGHAHVTERLNDVDPNWSWEPAGVDECGSPKFDDIGGLWIRMTVCGVTRTAYGHAVPKAVKDTSSAGRAEGRKIVTPESKANAIKEVIGDAIRNGAMRFGVALDLWKKNNKQEFSEEVQEPDQKQPEPLITNQWVADVKDSLRKFNDLASLQKAWNGYAKTLMAEDAKKEFGEIKAFVGHCAIAIKSAIESAEQLSAKGENE